jgi:Uncharacterised nucleotidyltransferase
LTATTREPEGLVWVLRRAVGEDLPSPDDDTWRSAIPALASSRLASLTAHLLGPGVPSLAPDIRLTLEASGLLADAMAERGKRQVREGGEILNRLGIPWVVLKSWPLSVRLYPTPSCRPSVDLDLLVAPEHSELVIGELEAAGYVAEPGDRSYHTRLLRGQPARGMHEAIELHHSPGPPGHGGPSTRQVLASRKEFPSEVGPLWIPDPATELDLLVRHYLRHGGYQAILLLDLILMVRRMEGPAAVVRHPLGALIAADLERLGLRPCVTGEHRIQYRPLATWMARRTFEERRSARHISLVGIPLALSRSPGAAAAALGRVIWPQRPTPRWLPVSRTRLGRLTWRFRRLAGMGR